MRPKKLEYPRPREKLAIGRNEQSNHVLATCTQPKSRLCLPLSDTWAERGYMRPYAASNVNMSRCCLGGDGSFGKIEWVRGRHNVVALMISATACCTASCATAEGPALQHMAHMALHTPCMTVFQTIAVK